MSKFFIYCEEDTLSAPNRAALERVMSAHVQADVPLAVEVVLVSAEEIRALNKQTRNIDRVTDVLSYPTLEGIKGKPIVGAQHAFDVDEEGNLLLGCIALCAQRAKEQAIEYNHSYLRELHYLIVHGIMHCLGYDHETDEEKKEMRAQEECVLDKLGIRRE